MNDLLSESLARRLRRLELLEDIDRFPELNDADVPEAIQRTLLGGKGIRNVLRSCVERDKAGLSMTTTELLIGLEHMRRRPDEAAQFLGGLKGQDFGTTVTRFSLRVARNLHEVGRGYGNIASFDLSINYMMEAQSEFLFTLSTGFLSSEDTTEVLGKYAVAVAFSSRWRRTNRHVLERALKYHQWSIDTGNTSPKAYSYLVELLAELFNETSDKSYLEEAIEIAETHGLWVAMSELLLKRGVFQKEVGGSGWANDFQLACEYADYKPLKSKTGIEHVQSALVDELALTALSDHCPLEAKQIRLPYGFLNDLGKINYENREILRKVVLEKLGKMRDDLKNRSWDPNLVAQQVLFAVLRDALSQGYGNTEEDAELIVDVAREAMSRGGDRYLEYQYAAALLARAEALREKSFASEAIEEAHELITRYPNWPLPQVNNAVALGLLNQLDSTEERSIRANDAWVDAAGSVVNFHGYRRTDLGGRSNVFAIEDARGDLATSLIFKRMQSRSDAEREAENMEVLLNAVHDKGYEGRFGVPRSLSIVTLSTGNTYHVIESQAGELLSDLAPNVDERLLSECIEFLALFHNAMGLRVRKTFSWKNLKDVLKPCSRTIFTSKRQSDDFIEAMKESLPKNLPLAKKRDAHASNWIIDRAGRLVSIDLESNSLLPVGHDVAQLIEDYALLPVTPSGFVHRYELLHAYLNVLDIDVNIDEAKFGYGWFALLRATWVASSPNASKARYSHAKQLVQYLVSAPEHRSIWAPAEMLARVLHQSNGTEISEVDAKHREKSRQLSRILRHRARDFGLHIDDAGFVSLEELASVVDMSVDEIKEVATHPAEPRFQIDNDCVRALYGHSLSVSNLSNLKVIPPEILFHGTSWDALENILDEGLKPMGRQKVHLTNDPREALEGARWHSSPALLAISTATVESLQSVADAVWTADAVAPELIEIRNPFTEISTPPDWLIDAIGAS